MEKRFAFVALLFCAAAAAQTPTPSYVPVPSTPASAQSSLSKLFSKAGGTVPLTVTNDGATAQGAALNVQLAGGGNFSLPNNCQGSDNSISIETTLLLPTTATWLHGAGAVNSGAGCFTPIVPSFAAGDGIFFSANGGTYGGGLDGVNVQGATSSSQTAGTALRIYPFGANGGDVKIRDSVFKYFPQGIFDNLARTKYDNVRVTGSCNTAPSQYLVDWSGNGSNDREANIAFFGASTACHYGWMLRDQTGLHDRIKISDTANTSGGVYIGRASQALGSGFSGTVSVTGGVPSIAVGSAGSGYVGPITATVSGLTCTVAPVWDVVLTGPGGLVSGGVQAINLWSGTGTGCTGSGTVSLSLPPVFQANDDVTIGDIEIDYGPVLIVDSGSSVSFHGKRFGEYGAYYIGPPIQVQDSAQLEADGPLQFSEAGLSATAAQGATTGGAYVSATTYYFRLVFYNANGSIGIATGAGVPASYASGLAASGTGACIYQAANGGGVNAQITINVSGGAFSSFGALVNAGYGYTTNPTSWTYVSGSACSAGTVTTSGGSLGAGQVTWNTTYSGAASFAPASGSTNQITLTWTAPANATSVVIYGSPIGSPTSTPSGMCPIATVSGTTTTYTSTGAESCTVGSGAPQGNIPMVAINGIHAGFSIDCPWEGSSAPQDNYGDLIQLWNGEYRTCQPGMKFVSTLPTASVYTAGKEFYLVNAQGVSGHDSLYFGYASSNGSTESFGWSPDLTQSQTAAASGLYKLAGPVANTGSTSITQVGSISLGTGVMSATSHLEVKVSIDACSTTSGVPTAACTGTANTGTCTYTVKLSTSNTGGGGLLTSPAITAAKAGSLFGIIQDTSGTAELGRLDALYGSSVVTGAPIANTITNSGALYLNFFITNSVSGDNCFIDTASVQLFQ